MSIFYINNDKTEDTEFIDKYDFAKFLDGASNVPVDSKEKTKITVIGETE